MAKPKTRIGVTVGGQLKELLSIRERTNGDLVVMLRTAEFMDGEGPENPTVEQRFSVHRSLESNPPGRLIKQTMAFRDGKEVTTSQFRTFTEEKPFCANLYGRACPNLLPSRYNMTARSIDRVITLFEQDAAGPTLFYFVAALDLNFPVAAFEKASLNTTIIEFSHFRIVVLFGFFPAPPIDSGLLVHTMSSLPKIKGQEAMEDVRFKIDDFTPELSVAFFSLLTAGLANDMANRVRGFVGAAMTPEMSANIGFAFSLYVLTPPNLPQEA